MICLPPPSLQTVQKQATFRKTKYNVCAEILYVLMNVDGLGLSQLKHIEGGGENMFEGLVVCSQRA